MNTGESLSDDGQHWMMFAGDEATPTQSYFIAFRQPPSRVWFGIHNGPMFDCTVTNKLLSSSGADFTRLRFGQLRSTIR